MIIHNDCLIALQDLIDQGIQVDSIVTDPPYELGFMGKDWDKSGIAYNADLWRLCLAVLKPGGHLLSFGGSRTYHRMACAIEDAGFEIRDQIMWIYGSGFPKSLDVSKAIDKMADAEREVIGVRRDHDIRNASYMESTQGLNKGSFLREITTPSTDSAKQWNGFGTALKPAHEPIVLARKPLEEKTIAKNVLKYGTGAINIDGCRVETNWETDPTKRGWKGGNSKSVGITNNFGCVGDRISIPNVEGRFPANLIHDGSDEVEEEFNKYPTAKGYGQSTAGTVKGSGSMFGTGGTNPNRYDMGGGTPSRFFYCAKASKKERQGSKHPTVKPLALMRYLCRLVTPPGGTILDPFAGSGTTGQAAIVEGFNPILIEREAEYIQDIKQRLNEKIENHYDHQSIRFDDRQLDMYETC